MGFARISLRFQEGCVLGALFDGQCTNSGEKEAQLGFCHVSRCGGYYCIDPWLYFTPQSFNSLSTSETLAGLYVLVDAEISQRHFLASCIGCRVIKSKT